jgi:hypothetical protein
MRHYQAGFRIGEQSLPRDFDGVLPWGFVDNRPFLMCTHGFGLCHWRLGLFEEASAPSSGCSGSTRQTTRACALSSATWLRSDAGMERQES